jgi:SAM-dependent methyltransferase
MEFDNSSNMIGGFAVNDGTIDFYLRINYLIKKTDVVLDLGAGRAAWYEDDRCETRRNLRLLKDKVAKVIAADVNLAVMNNRASDEQIIMEDGVLNLPNNSVDLVIADYVLEHVDNSKEFSNQVNRVLKSGGWLCARTPHKYCYVAIAASLIRNFDHSKFLRYVQPSRKEVDIFPTRYKLNTLDDVGKNFSGWKSSTFIFRANPAYYFGSKFIYKLQSVVHGFLPSFLCGNLFIFVQKP